MAVVVDQAISLAIEINDVAKETIEEASGTAIYSKVNRQYLHVSLYLKRFGYNLSSTNKIR